MISNMCNVVHEMVLDPMVLCPVCENHSKSAIKITGQINESSLTVIFIN